MPQKVVISRIQHRRGLRENLPQPLRPGELALTSDTRQVWIGGDPALMPAGVSLYNPADIATAQNLIDTVILEVRFNDSFGETQFDIVRSSLVNNLTFTLEEEDILWDATLRTNPPNSFVGFSVYIAADQGLNVNHTLANIEAAILGTSASALHISTDYVGDLGPFGGDFDVDGFLNLDTAGQSTIIATLLNRIHGSSTGIATTNLNLEVGRVSAYYAAVDHGHDASEITSGTLDIARLPSGALERLVVVPNEVARFALTVNDIQRGDTVLQEDTNIMYMVIDESQLSNATGYQEYTAARASAVDWSGVENKPPSFPPSSHVLATTTGLGGEHTVSGLTAGQVLRATGTTTAAFGFLAETDIPNLNANKITAGVFTTARLGTGVPNGTTYLRGDGTWATVPDTNTNDYVDSASFNPATGNLILGRTGALADLTVSLDGRYLTSFTDTNDYVDAVSFDVGNGVLTLGRTGALADLTVDLDGRYLTSFTDTNDYVDAVSFNAGNGVLTLGRTGALVDLTVDLDGRYLEVAGDTMTGTLTSQTVLPSVHATYNLGSSAVRYNDTYSVTFHAGGADLAERYSADAPYSEGTVVKIGGTKEVTATTTAFDRRVFGVVSISPGLALNTAAPDNEETPFIAIAGRVLVRVTGPVEKGQRLVTSDLPGVAMASDDEVSPFAVIGRALEDKITEEEGMVLAVVGSK